LLFSVPGGAAARKSASWDRPSQAGAGHGLAAGPVHGSAQVHAQVAGDVGFGLELFEIILIGLGEDVPVEVFEVVAGDVFAGCSENSTEKP